MNLRGNYLMQFEIIHLFKLWRTFASLMKRHILILLLESHKKRKWNMKVKVLCFGSKSDVEMWCDVKCCVKIWKQHTRINFKSLLNVIIELLSALLTICDKVASVLNNLWWFEWGNIHATGLFPPHPPPPHSVIIVSRFCYLRTITWLNHILLHEQHSRLFYVKTFRTVNTLIFHKPPPSGC
jgi:hypothetical protein